MMLLLDYLDDNILIANTYNLFDYTMFANRFANRFGNREIRDDVTESRIANIAQNTIDINRTFLQGISNKVVNPFKTFGELTIYTAGTGFTDTTTPDLTDVRTPNLTEDTIPNLTETTTPDLTSTTTRTGTVTDESAAANFVNTNNAETTSTPHDNQTGNGTTTNDLTDETKSTGSTTRVQSGSSQTKRTGSETTKHSGTTTVQHDNTGQDTTDKSGYNLQDYQLAMEIYLNFIDIVVDLIAKDILKLVPRGWNYGF